MVSTPAVLVEMGIVWFHLVLSERVVCGYLREVGLLRAACTYCFSEINTHIYNPEAPSVHFATRPVHMYTFTSFTGAEV